MRAPLACALSDPSLGAPGRPGWEGSTKFAVPHFGAPPLPPVPGATQGSLDALPWALSNWVSETHGPSSASFHCTDEEPEAWKNGMVGSWPPRKRTHDWFQAPMPCCEQLELSLAQRESVHLASCRAALRAQTRGPREVWLPSKTTQSARAEMAVHSDSADHCLLGTQCSLRPRLFPPLLFLLWILLSCDLRGAAQGPGEWTLWGSWSRCSSSCGRGVSVRRRHCVRLPEEELCWGDSHEYRVCQLPFYPSTFMLTQDCPPGAIPFRDLQCSLYNGHPVLGTQKTYQWVPFHGAPNLCDLNCLAEGHAFYHSFGRVLDGTPCTPGTQGLCVAGRCLSAGCDGLLGSGTLEDRCGLCGGANDSCLFVQRVFRDAGAFAGYWNVTLIPEGARHIRVTQRSHNHLALVTRDGHYVLNGDGVLSLPGTYEAAGTRVVYTRSAGPEETLQATGPTSQELLLQTPAGHALTAVVAHTGFFTTVAATLCSRPVCWAATAWPRRPATRCGSCSSTKTARLCDLESMCGHQATAHAHHWPHIENTCWLPGDTSALMAHRTGYCCLRLAMLGFGVLRRTAEFD
ncbi:ADAMTS-like protein 5 isoform X9 [Rattus norvegicus]|uniref:ADAMTS-like protein 5 isoform X9 n=1 Tax=Rattus norvegicus TaxID=10116 RepID=UPI001916E67B|nr:ADAMTS-like protein 5 isoform X10 [Rattus norvegicus]